MLLPIEYFPLKYLKNLFEYNIYFSFFHEDMPPTSTAGYKSETNKYIRLLVNDLTYYFTEFMFLKYLYAVDEKLNFIARFKDDMGLLTLQFFDLPPTTKLTALGELQFSWK